MQLPFSVWRETPTGGAVNFITGAICFCYACRHRCLFVRVLCAVYVLNVRAAVNLLLFEQIAAISPFLFMFDNCYTNACGGAHMLVHHLLWANAPTAASHPVLPGLFLTLAYIFIFIVNSPKAPVDSCSRPYLAALGCV